MGRYLKTRQRNNSMSFENELSDRLQEAAADLTVRASSLSHIHNRAEERQRRRQLATRAGSALSLLAVVAVVGLLIVQRGNNNQTIGTTGGTFVSGEQSGSSGDGDGEVPGEPGNAVDEIDTSTSGTDDAVLPAGPIIAGAYGPVIPLIVEPSGVEEWQQVLPPIQVTQSGSGTDSSSETLTPAVMRYDFTGNAIVVRAGADLYVDSGTGWRRLSMPEELDVVAVDAHDEARLVVAGSVTVSECDSYMAVATLENDRWSISRVPSTLPAGTRSEPLTAQIRTTGAVTVLSTAEKIRFDPLCLIRYIVASSSSPASGTQDPVGGSEKENETPLEDVILGDVTIDAWDINLAGPIQLSLADVVEARVTDLGIKTTISSGEEFFIPLDKLAELRPFDEQYQALLASARVTDDWPTPVDSVVEAMLDSSWVVRVSQSSPDRSSDNATPLNVWQVKNLQFIPWSEPASSIPVTAALGVVNDEVVATFASKKVSFRPALQENTSPSLPGDTETSESTSEAALDKDTHFYAARDGSVTAMDLSTIPSQGADRTFRYLDALRNNGQEVTIAIDNGETTVSVGDQQWKLTDLCGFDSGWARLGEVDGELRLITTVNGQQRLYQLTGSN